MFTCEISIIIILICQKLGSHGPIQQKIELPSPYIAIYFFSNLFPTIQRLYDLSDFI